ncbi:MAG: hypothetical protein AAF591_14730 [Verrucomicrobiota bacterium]
MKTQLIALGVFAACATLTLADQHETKKQPANTPKQKQAAPKSRPAPPPAPKPKPAPKPHSTGITLIVEFIELEQGDLTELCLNHDFTTDATDLRVSLQEMIDDDDATVAATAILHTRSGQRAKTEAIEEIIYTNEIDESHPTGFETRNVGLTLEVDPVVSADGKQIDVNLVPELTQHVDDIELGPTSAGVPVKAPIFHTAKITTSVTVSNGRYALLGSTQLAEPANPYFENPIVLVLLRATAH